LQGDEWLADRYARRLQAQHTHLFIDQTLLVPLAQRGVLGGRTYEVLMHAFPADELQQRLDTAAQRWPGATSLRDFRVSEIYCQMEAHALRGAQRLVTPHAEVARHLRASFNAPVECIDWHLPSHRTQRPTTRQGRPVVAFAASALARKGAHEMAQAMRHLGWRLLVLGTRSSDPQLWADIDVDHVSYEDSTWLNRCDVVALPAYVEHSPRALLTAVARGLPVVASPACGLPRSLGAIEVHAGDIAGLITALESAVDPGWRR
jgi:glycosyltransferase involved in cell wall biosynthesis